MSATNSDTSSEPEQATAGDLRLAGNDLYKEGNFLGALTKYTKALSLSEKPDNAVLRNLSSARFELGQYEACLGATKEAMANEDDAAKKRVLKTRLGKCLYALGEWSETTVALEGVDGKEAEELRQAAVWRCSTVNESRKFDQRFALGLPKFRPQLEPGHMEYFPRGHDTASPAVEHASIYVHLLTHSPMSIFYGGAGDARHFYQQLHHIHAYGKLTKKPDTGEMRKSIMEPLFKVNPELVMAFMKNRDEEFEKLLSELDDDSRGVLVDTFDKLAHFKEPDANQEVNETYHFVVQDLHPRPMARSVVIWAMFEEANKQEDELEKEAWLVCAWYVYACDIMPEWCFSRLQSKLAELESTQEANFGITWLTIDSASVEAVKKVLKDWTSDYFINLFDVGYVQDNVRPNNSNPENTFEEFGVNKWYEIYQKTSMNVCTEVLCEKFEPKLAGLLKNMRKKVDYKALSVYAKSNWKVNVCMLWERRWYDPRLGGSKGCWQKCGTTDPFITTDDVYEEAVDYDECIKERQKSHKSLTIVDLMVPWLRSCADALKDHDISVEAQVGEVLGHLDKMHYASPDRRFDAVYLSNIPDYTGGHLTAGIHALALLKPDATSYLSYNNQANPVFFESAWQSYAAEYLCLSQSKHIRSLFGLRPKSVIPEFGIFNLNENTSPELLGPNGPPDYMSLCWARKFGPTKPLQNPPVKGLIQRWLFALFFKIALPVPREKHAPSGSAVHQPLTLVEWIRLCCYLVEARKMPKHWIATVVDSLLSGSISTSARAPSTCPVSDAEAAFPIRDAKSFSTKPFLPELNVLLTQMNALIPFNILTPLPSPAALTKYTLAFEIFDFTCGYGVPVLGLLFLAPDKNVLGSIVKGDGRPNVRHFRDAMAGGSGPPSDKFIWVTAWEWDPSEEAAVFWIEDGVMGRMEREGWGAWIVRTDRWTVMSRVSEMVDADVVME